MLSLIIAEVILGSLAQLVDLIDDSVAAVRFKFSGFSIAPAASQTVQTGFQRTIGISPAVADHKGTVTEFGVKAKLLQSMGDDLGLGDSCGILAGTIDTIYQWRQSEVVTYRLSLVLWLAGGDGQGQTMLVHTIQLFGDAVKDRSEQTSRDVLSRMVRIIKCRYLAVIAPVNKSGRPYRCLLL